MKYFRILSYAIGLTTQLAAGFKIKTLADIRSTLKELIENSLCSASTDTLAFTG